MSINMKSVRTKLNQQGVASILVAGIFVVVISLIVTSFALLMRREQRQSLDKQLSTQAYYAAESGVNAAVKALHNNAAFSNNDCSKTDDLLPGSSDLGGGLKYTCVLVDDNPRELVYSPTSTEKSTFLKISAPHGGFIDISWQASEDLFHLPLGFKYVGDALADDHLLPETVPYYSPGGGDPYQFSNFEKQIRGSGILRVSLMPIKSPITRDNLINETQTLFLYPNDNPNYYPAPNPNEAGVHHFSTTKAGKGVFVNGQCNTRNSREHHGRFPYECNVKIGLTSGVDTYYMRLKSIYTPHSVQISVRGPGGGQISQPGTQAVIDSTGKANDVLRRIQVRVPLNASFSYPEFGLQTTNRLCKLTTYAVWFLNRVPDPDKPHETRDYCW